MTSRSDELKTELAALALRLVRKAAGKKDASEKEPLSDDALDTFKTVGAWDVANRRVKTPQLDDPDDTFRAMKNRISTADKPPNGVTRQ